MFVYLFVAASSKLDPGFHRHGSYRDKRCLCAWQQPFSGTNAQLHYICGGSLDALTVVTRSEVRTLHALE